MIFRKKQPPVDRIPPDRIAPKRVQHAEDLEIGAHALIASTAITVFADGRANLNDKFGVNEHYYHGRTNIPIVRIGEDQWEINLKGLKRIRFEPHTSQYQKPNVVRVILDVEEEPS